MKRLLLTALLFPVFCSGGLAADSIGQVAEITGSASAEDASGVRRELALRGDVFLRDTVQTAPGGRLLIELADGTTITIGENASFVIDEYVFDPAQASENRSSIRLMRGLFKIVTDQITKLNPNRFKVSTHDGLIGIRGCAVGFDLTGDEEKVFIVDVSDIESVEVFLNQLPSDPNGLRQLSITRSGRGVVLSREKGLLVFEFNPSQIGQILRLAAGAGLDLELPDLPDEPDNGYTPHDPFGDPSGPEPNMDGAGGGSEDPGQDSEWITLFGEDDQRFLDELWQALLEDGTFVLEDGHLIDTETGEILTPDEVDEFFLSLIDDFDEFAFDEPLPEDPGTGDDGTAADEDLLFATQTDPATGFTTDYFVYPVLNDFSSYANIDGPYWEWAIWEENIVTYDADGFLVEDYVDHFSEVIGSFLEPSEFAALVAGGPQSLFGSGSAGAVVNDFMGNVDYMFGSLGINLFIPGGGGTPSWNGNLNVSGGLSSLSTMLMGSFDLDGNMDATTSSYFLNAFGTLYAAPSSEFFDGALIKDPATFGPGAVIKGAVLQFELLHGPNGPVVTGAGGADF